MEELRKIMNELTGVEYGLESFVSLLENLEEVYDLRRDKEQMKNLKVFQIIVASLLENLSSEISEIEQLVLENKEN